MLMEMAGSRSCGGRAFQDNGLDARRYKHYEPKSRVDGPAALRRPALLGQSGQCPTNTRFKQQTNEQTNRQTEGHRHRVKPPLLRELLNNLSTITRQFRRSRRPTGHAQLLDVLVATSAVELRQHERQ